MHNCTTYLFHSATTTRRGLVSAFLGIPTSKYMPYFLHQDLIFSLSDLHQKFIRSLSALCYGAWMTEIYITKTKKLSGTNGTELFRHAHSEYHLIVLGSKRKPYLRSAYFNKEKVFLDYFWNHLRSKNWNDRIRRLRFYSCALDLIKNTRAHPTLESSISNSVKLHRFFGMNKQGERFAVQIKEYTKRKEKHFISVFPIP